MVGGRCEGHWDCLSQKTLLYEDISSLLVFCAFAYHEYHHHTVFQNYVGECSGLFYIAQMAEI